MGADPLIGRAQERETAGDVKQAAELLAQWLAMNPGAPGSARVFARYFQLEQDFPSLLSASMRFATSAKGVPGAGEQYGRIARLLDVSGRVEEARDVYLAAINEGASSSTLVSAFLLSLEMNDTASMQTALERLKGTGGDAEPLLGALMDLRAGREAAARGALVGLAEKTGDSGLAVRALWVLYEYSRARGDAAGQASARKKLDARFPGSPEAAIASSTDVFLTPRPEALVGAAEQTAGSSPGSTAAPPSPRGSLAVQAGSFQMKENADDLMRELTEIGFSPVVRHETVDGKDRYRVFAGVGVDADAAKALLAALKQKGYSGFIVKDAQ